MPSPHLIEFASAVLQFAAVALPIFVTYLVREGPRKPRRRRRP